MSLLERVIVAHKCRSMHHYIAMEALNQIGGEQGEAWKGMLLQYNSDYLEGAKAPDAKFKDFRNHVLHVREGEWGGARDAAMDWYGRSVEALREKDWKDAAFCLGVLSHYYADICQPFHTGQTEEEGAIHRAVEWSIVKSQESIFAQLEEDGYPEIEGGDGPGFVADMVLAAAKASNPHYETFIDHYDIDTGVQDPPSGIDETMFSAVCEMVAYAVSGLSVLITRAVDEAGIDAPKSNLTVRGYLSTLNIPMRWITRKLSDRRDQKTVEKMYKELQKTGKVIKSLSDDDKLIRKLHARQVLRRPIAELDAQELKPIGSKHEPWEPVEVQDVEDDVELEAEGLAEIEVEESVDEIIEAEDAEREESDEADAPAKLSRAERRAAKKAEKEARKAEKAEAKRLRAEAKLAERELEEVDVEEDLAGEEFVEDEVKLEGADVEPGEAAEYDLEVVDEDIEEFDEEIDLDEGDEEEEFVLDLEGADPDNEVVEYEESFEDSEDFDAELAELAAVDLDEDIEEFAAAALAAEADFESEEAASQHLRRDRLTLESPIVDAPSIGRKTAKRLAKANIRTVIDLLDADPEAVAEQLNLRYITAESLTDWQDQTMLMMEVPGLRTHDVQVLVGAGIRSGEDLAKASAHDVFQAAIDFLSSDEGTRISRFEDEELVESEVEDWIDLAKQEAA